MIVDARWRGRRDEPHVVRDVDGLWLVGEVVDHVVQDPRVALVDRVAVAPRELVDRLLLASGHERVEAAVGTAVALPLARGAVAQPHAVVEMDDVGRRDVAAALAVGQRVDEVRLHPNHEAVDRWLRDLQVLVEDQIRAGDHVVGTGGVIQLLGARRGCGRLGRGRAGLGRERERAGRQQRKRSDDPDDRTQDCSCLHITLRRHSGPHDHSCRSGRRAVVVRSGFGA